MEREGATGRRPQERGTNEGKGIGREAGEAGGYGYQTPAEQHPGTDVDMQGARRSDGLTGSGADDSAEFTERDRDRATGTPADERRS